MEMMKDIRLIPTIPFTGTHGLLQALQVLVQIIIGLSIGGLTVPSQSWSAQGFRLGLLVWLVPKIFDYSTNRQYSFGNALADQLILSCVGWNLLTRLLELSLLPFISPGPPRWIRPTKEELARVLKLRTTRPLSNTTPDQLDQASEELIPRQWEHVPFPAPFSLDRLLYAYDYLMLIRPTTSDLLPWQFRAFEWSLPALTAGGVAGRRFGKPETGPRLAFAHLLVYLACFVYVDNLAIRSIGEIKMAELAIVHQLLLTIAAGCLIGLSGGPGEAVTFPLFITRRIFPPTALLAHFNQPYLASSIQDFWGNRWHRRVRRQLTRLGLLFPLGGTKTGNAFWAYFLSPNQAYPIRQAIWHCSSTSPPSPSSFHKAWP
ncbi:hypothetical protein, variant [Puccinia triticina 1-1 BBBD Race 1]|uniref:MBOAT_2 domain-containing protein n=1 Tax=Puccinia triticina (isolate 1-1 / race 1 (BBBD)) TaxID=630390 RepID=A0A180G9F5_PUCT1|nr:hypothetical protein, variant [Puccinia triticina 1-1 BBBD Race 1]